MNGKICTFTAILLYKYERVCVAENRIILNFIPLKRIVQGVIEILRVSSRYNRFFQYLF